jgi:hypothetical protein
LLLMWFAVGLSYAGCKMTLNGFAMLRMLSGML